MQICLLHLDNSLKLQKDFLQTCVLDGAKQIEAEEIGSAVRLWATRGKFAILREKISEYFAGVNEPQLVFMGSGDFHHATALLLEATLKKYDEKITLIHFDNHPDFVKSNLVTSCGSWVNDAAQHPKIEKIITIGVCSKDLQNAKRMGGNLALIESGKLVILPYKEKQEMDNLLSYIPTKNVYITIDKDVLANEDITSNWDQGQMRLPYLLRVLREIGERHTIIGADVNGDYSPPKYSGNLLVKLLKNVERLIDQPRDKPDIAKTAALNSASNHAILEVLSEMIG